MARRTAPRVPDPAGFPPVAVTVHVVVLTLHERRLHVLLLELAAAPWKGAWALPGGFLRPDETLDEAAARELREETGVDASAYLEQVGAYGDPGRDPRQRVVTVAYLAVLQRVGALAAGTGAARAKLAAVDELAGPRPARKLAFDHETILADALAQTREKLSSTSLATAFVGPEFTLAELREVYEAAWGTALDPGNFRRKVLATENFVVPTGRRAVSGPEGGKPPETYRAYGRARLHPPLQPPPQLEMRFSSGASASSRPLASSDLDPDRAAVWRCWLGDEAAFQRTLLEKRLLAPAAHGDEVIADEEWSAFLQGMQVGDWVVAPIARGRVAVGEITGPIRERPKAGDRRLRRVRDVAWRAELPRGAVPEEIRDRLDAPGALTPIRVASAARKIRQALERP